MCQFNLILVKNTQNKKILKDNEYDTFGNAIDGFSPYVKGVCNCNSFVGSMKEYDGNSYSEMIESNEKNKIKRANDIKELMSRPDYKELQEKYIETKTYLSDELQKFFKGISNREVVTSPEFQAAQSKLLNFIQENSLMEECCLMEEDDEEDELDFETPNGFEEFLEYTELFKKLLANEETILFACIWSEPENMSVVKELNMKDLVIEDLASLDFNQILKIYK